jgi:IS5 family transposase
MKAKLAPERAASREAREPSGLVRKGCLGLPIGHAKIASSIRYHRSRKKGAIVLTFALFRKARSKLQVPALVVIAGLCGIPPNNHLRDRSSDHHSINST